MLKTIGIVATLALALLVGRIDAATAVPVGGTCGAFHGGTCDAGLFCDHKPGTCRLIGARGKCVVIPFVCALGNVTSQVCGCNGTTYWNDCMRIRAMQQKAHNGACSK
jgi:hypothetical protein